MSIFNKKRLGISIQDNKLVVCETVSDGPNKREINSLNIIKIPKDVILNGRINDKKALKKLFLKAFRTAKPYAISANSMVFEVPEEFTFQHTMILPASLSEEQVREASVFQAEKLLPFDLEQVSWDIKIIPQQDENQLVLFTAVPLDMVQEYYDVFMSCGLMPLGFSIRAENLLVAIARKSSKPTVLMDLQNKYINVLFFKGENLMALEQINIGEDDLKKAIQQKFELLPKNLKAQIKELPAVDISLATLALLQKIKKELTGLMASFVKLERAHSSAESASSGKEVSGVNPASGAGSQVLKEKKDAKQQASKSADSYFQAKQDDKKKSWFRTLLGKFKKTREKKGVAKKVEKVVSPVKEVAPEVEAKLEKFNFFFTGEVLFHEVFREFFYKHGLKHLSQLNTGLKKLLNIKTRDQNRLSRMTRGKRRSALKRFIPSVIGASLANYSTKDKALKPINLLPPMVRSIALWKETSYWLYAAATFMLVVSVSWLMVFGFMWGNTTAQLKVANTNYILVERKLEAKKSKAFEAKIKAANEELKVLNGLRASKQPYYDIIKIINDSVPEEVQFSSLKYGHHQDKSLFEWKAKVSDRENVIKTHQIIKDLPFISKIIFPPSNLDSSNQIEFSILFNLKENS